MRQALAALWSLQLCATLRQLGSPRSFSYHFFIVCPMPRRGLVPPMKAGRRQSPKFGKLYIALHGSLSPRPGGGKEAILSREGINS